MWGVRTEKLAGDRGLRYTIERNSKGVAFTEVVEALRNDASFRAFLTATLAAVPYSAFRWETPGVTLKTGTKPFEFVVLDSPSLARTPDEQAFAEHFTDPAAAAVSFANLGRNAMLVVPTPQAQAEAYGHLAAFVRLAPESQHREFWHLVGMAMAKRLSIWPVWLSTAGAGVSWLHVRLDDQPKYYVHAPYARAT